MAMAPMEAIGWASNIGVQVTPPFVVFQTPPPTVPNKYSFGLPGKPVAATTRPPRNGPIMRHCISGNDGAAGSWENARRAANEKTRAVENRTTKGKRRSSWLFLIFIFESGCGVYTIAFGRQSVGKPHGCARRTQIFRGHIQSAVVIADDMIRRASLVKKNPKRSSSLRSERRPLQKHLQISREVQSRAKYWSIDCASLITWSGLEFQFCPRSTNWHRGRV